MELKSSTNQKGINSSDIGAVNETWLCGMQ